MKSCVEFHHMIVELRIVRNARKLRLTFLKETNAFRLTAPSWVKSSEMIAFMEKNRAWMESQIRANAIPVIEYAAGECHMLLGHRVILGESGIPSGEEFLHWRTGMLKDYVAEILPLWTQRMQVSVSSITFRKTKSIWGSCRSRTHRITLNTNLAMYPRECTEFILVHELNHIRHPDHSAAFYSDMDYYLSDWRDRDRILKTLDVKPVPVST